MKFEIKPRFSGEVIFSLETKSLKLCVEAAAKQNVDLSGANLDGAKGVSKYRTTPLYMLLDQPGKIRAYKLVNERNEGYQYGGIVYEIGKEVGVYTANVDENTQCGAGINLATLDWCMQDWRPGYKILIAEFEAKDIAAIPIATDGKFRVHRCKIVGEKDPAELGLAEQS